MTARDQLFPTVPAAKILQWALWPIAAFLVFHRTIIMAVNGSVTDDFTTVYRAAVAFLRNQPVYGEDLTTVDPHYLYPPSGTLLMAPLGYVDLGVARVAFIGASTIATVICAALLLRLFEQPLDTWALPATIAAFYSSESVMNTLIFTNFNAFVLLGELLFMLALMRRRDLLAGIPIGLTLAVKPVLAPLLLLPLLNRQWKALIGAALVPGVLTGVALLKAVDPMEFVRKTVPYLGATRDYFNSSLSGWGLYYGVHPWLVLALRASVVVMAVVALWLLYRYYRETDELLWLTTSSGVLLLATFLASSLGQGYYSMLLFPLVMTVIRPGSAMRNWPMWVAVYACMAFDFFYSTRWTAFGRAVQYTRVPWGWYLMLSIVVIVLLGRHMVLRRLAASGASGSATDADGATDAGATAAVAAGVPAAAVATETERTDSTEAPETGAVDPVPAPRRPDTDDEEDPDEPTAAE